MERPKIVQLEVKSFRTLTEKEEKAIAELLKPHGYWYWGGGSIMVTEDGVSCLNIDFDSGSAATIGPKVGQKLRERFKVNEVRRMGVQI